MPDAVYSARVIATGGRHGPSAATTACSIFYRLNVFPIAVPPLQDRAEDISMLVEVQALPDAPRAFRDQPIAGGNFPLLIAVSRHPDLFAMKLLGSAVNSSAPGGSFPSVIRPTLCAKPSSE